MDLTDRFASLHKRFLIESYPSVYAAMERNGMLPAHLEETGRQGQAMFEAVSERLRKNAAGAATEAERQALLEQIPLVAEEMVIQDLITAPLT